MDPLHDLSGYPMPAPQLLNHNPPPRIFGGYAADGLPTTLPLDISGQLFGDPGSLMDDTNEAKRRRIARACDMCRKKKIKCDGKLPSCTHCMNYKTECVFTQVEKKKNPPKGAKYIEGLENRLGRMENLLKLSGLLNEDDNDLGMLEKRLAEEKDRSRRTSTAPPTSPYQGNLGTPTHDGSTSSLGSGITSPEPHESEGDKRSDPQKKLDDAEVLSEMMCSLVTNNCGETRYIGSSSGFSIFSPRGIQWVNEKTGDSSFQEMINSTSVDDNKWVYWKPDVFGDLFERRVFRPLPPKEECVSLLKDYFDNFNCMFPLFHQQTFMHLVERQYSHDPYDGSGWWASLNVALAISHRLRVMSNLVPQEEDQKAWGYLKNALAVFAELTMRNTDLLSVQALLGMSLFMQGTPNPQPTFFLVAAAIRLSYSIGLHKRGSGFNLNPVEIEQRKRVFWIAYLVDKDICLRSGRPPALYDDDINVELPSADPDDGIGNIPLADGKGKINLFRLMCEFAVIESKVYGQLYSTKASKQSDGELLNTIGELDRELEEWKDNIPVDFRPEHEIKASHTPLVLHIVVLHFAYYNTLMTIHRMSIHHGYWTSRLSNYALQGLNAKPLNPRVYSSAALCVAAARASIHLIKYVPQGDFACVWLILYFPISALVTLFGNILQNPQDPRARSDVRLMNVVVNFLSMLGSEEEKDGVNRMLNVCTEFERIAKVVLDKVEKESSSRRKRKGNNDQGAAPSNAPASRLSAQSTPIMANHKSPQFSNTPSSLTSHMTDQTGYTSMAGGLSPGNWMAETGFPDGSEYMTPHSGVPFTDSAHNDMNSALNLSAFQQPFVPQDLWQMPMTLEWDWANMTGGGYPGFENGLLEDPNLFANVCPAPQQL